MAIELTRDKFLALKRLFVDGELREPSPFWLTIPNAPRLAFSGEGVEEQPDACCVDFGSVTAVGEHRRVIRVESLGAHPTVVTLHNPHPWLRALWKGKDINAVELRQLGDAVDLDLTFRSDLPQEQTLAATLRLLANTEDGQTRAYDVLARLRARMDIPFGRYDFCGAAEPSPHDFGTLDPAEPTPEGPAPYVLTVDRVGPVPLRVALEDLPAWLTLEVRGYTRRGPAPGRVFESEAPVSFTLRPIRAFKFLGEQKSRIVLHTSDVRERYRKVEIELLARIETKRAAVHASLPAPIELVPPASRTVDVLLFNWGSAPARLSLEHSSRALEMGPLPTVPRAVGDRPGQEALQISILSQDLGRGSQGLSLRLRVEEGSPSTLDIPIQVHVLEVTTEPARLHFGRVRAGERKQLTLRVRATDGRALHLEASPLPEAAPVLKVSAQEGLVHVVCQGSDQPLAYQGPGIQLREKHLGFSREIPVSFRTRSAVSSTVVAGVVCALLAVLLLVLVLSQA